jgi:hypothetical protein
MFRNRAQKLEIGGQGKAELLSSLHERGTQLNRYAQILFDDPAFTTCDSSRWVIATQITGAELGLMDGATSAQIFARASSVGLALCPLELAPRLRLQLLDQAEGPYLTVASQKTRNDDAYPNGFYLRRIDGELWLRGYRATSDHIWEPASRFVFLAN